MLSGSVNFLLFAKRGRLHPGSLEQPRTHSGLSDPLGHVRPLYRANRPHHRHGEKSLLNPGPGELGYIIVHFLQLPEHFFISLYTDVRSIILVDMSKLYQVEVIPKGWRPRNNRLT